MYLVLFGFGAVLSIAGVMLAAAGVSPREGTFDTTLFTPGIVAAVGGLLLIGLGLALRTLQRIERALAARIMPRVVQAPIPGAADTSDESAEGAAFAFPSQMKWSPAAAAANASDDELAYAEPAYAVAEKTPDTARAGHRSNPPLTKPAASASGQANAEIDADHFGRRGNGAAATRTAPRPPIGARTTPMTERSKSPALDSMWPKGPRPARVTELQHTTEQAADDTSAHAVQNTAQSPMQNLASPPASVYDEPVPISVLRSGVVDGMAYTLYLDGSIEAQLPQGTLRFGSITELRQHLEQGA
jgi:hypothetical protein